MNNKLLLLVAAGFLGLMLSTPAQAQFTSRYPDPSPSLSVGVVTPNFGFYSSYGSNYGPTPSWRDPHCEPVRVRPYPSYYPVVPVRPLPYYPAYAYRPILPPVGVYPIPVAPVAPVAPVSPYYPPYTSRRW